MTDQKKRCTALTHANIWHPSRCHNHAKIGGTLCGVHLAQEKRRAARAARGAVRKVKALTPAVATAHAAGFASPAARAVATAVNMTPDQIAQARKKPSRQVRRSYERARLKDQAAR